MLTSSAPTNRQNAILIPLAFAAIYVIWGTTYFAIRLAVETIPPFFMAGTRFLLAGAITFILLRVRGIELPTWHQWRSAAVLGAFLLVGGNGLVTWSEQKIPSGMAALIVATVPLWITLFDWLFYQRIVVTKKILLGLILGSLGIALLIGPGTSPGKGEIHLIDWLIMLAAPVLWSIGSLHSRRANLPANSFMATAMEMLAGGALLILAGLLTGETARLNLSAISTRSIISLLYLLVFGSIVAFTAYVWLLKTVEAPRVATYTYVNPIIAVLLGWLLLGETLTPQMLLAVAIIVMAVISITTRQSKEKDSPPEPVSVASAMACESIGD